MQRPETSLVLLHDVPASIAVMLLDEKAGEEEVRVAMSYSVALAGACVGDLKEQRTFLRAKRAAGQPVFETNMPLFPGFDRNGQEQAWSKPVSERAYLQRIWTVFDILGQEVAALKLQGELQYMLLIGWICHQTPQTIMVY